MTALIHRRNLTMRASSWLGATSKCARAQLRWHSRVLAPHTRALSRQAPSPRRRANPHRVALSVSWDSLQAHDLQITRIQFRSEFGAHLVEPIIAVKVG